MSVGLELLLCTCFSVVAGIACVMLLVSSVTYTIIKIAKPTVWLVFGLLYLAC
jgi:hypothetical protein